MNKVESIYRRHRCTYTLCNCVGDATLKGTVVCNPVDDTYVLQVPVYRLKDLHFEVHPMEVHFTVSNDSVILPVCVCICANMKGLLNVILSTHSIILKFKGLLYQGKLCSLVKYVCGRSYECMYEDCWL